MPILKMEGGGVMPINQTSVIQPMTMCGSVTQSGMICPPSIITSHPAQQIQLLHQSEPPSPMSPIHAVPSMVNDDIAEVENSSKNLQDSSNQVSACFPKTVPFVVIEPQENIMVQLLVTDARDSSEEVFEKNTSTAADSQEIAQWTRIRETNVDSVD